jgi:hypothetical protein
LVAEEICTKGWSLVSAKTYVSSVVVRAGITQFPK